MLSIGSAELAGLKKILFSEIFCHSCVGEKGFKSIQQSSSSFFANKEGRNTVFLFMQITWILQYKMSLIYIKSQGSKELW